MKGTEFFLGILGLSRIERMTVTSVCSLTHSRPRGYTMLPPERSAEAQIMIVDADDMQACREWAASSAHREGKPVLMISCDPAQVREQAYVLPRTNFASRLVKILDQITVREFKFIPELVISDTPVLDSGPGLTATVAAAHIDAPRVLVVDDSSVVRARMRTLLDLHGLQIDLAEDAEKALALMRVTRYAMVFLDVMLPGLDGYAACRQMKNLGKNGPPIIMLTGRDSSFDKIRGVMAGCSRYLTKPIAVEDLHRVLREFIPTNVGRSVARTEDAL